MEQRSIQKALFVELGIIWSVNEKQIKLSTSIYVSNRTNLTHSNELFDKGDLDLGSSSRFSKAETEKASEFFGMCEISVVGDTLIRGGGGGESTSSSIEDDRDRVDRSRDLDRLRDRDLTLRLLESYPFGPTWPNWWYTLLLSSSSDSFLTSRLMPNLISSAI